MASRFLMARFGDQLLWACIDGDSLCTAPAIGERRFQSYWSPFVDEKDARQALLEAGADPAGITAEIRPNRARRG